MARARLFCGRGPVLSSGSTAAFSWFPGYRWRYTFCAGCGAHLGWQFVGRADDAFWGLVLARLIEAGE